MADTYPDAVLFLRYFFLLLLLLDLLLIYSRHCNHIALLSNVLRKGATNNDGGGCYCYSKCR
jgi:hypothetical protein